MSGPDRPPTEAELVTLAQEFEYEYLMFCSAGRRLREDAYVDDGDAGVDMNAWVEVFLLHVRNLLDFFACEPRGDDVVASHYVEGWTSDSGGEEMKWLEEMRRPINKRLAHITAYRRRVGKMDDARLITDTGQRIIALYRRFMNLLPRRRQSGSGWNRTTNRTDGCSHGDPTGALPSAPLVPFSGGLNVGCSPSNQGRFVDKPAKNQLATAGADAIAGRDPQGIRSACLSAPR